MERFPGRYSPFAYALLRIISGLLFACHGAQSVLGMFASPDHEVPAVGTFFWFGALLQLAGGFLVAFGLFGEYAAFLCSGEMAVAYFKVHAARGFFPVVNGGEPAVLYCFIFLYIALHGSGILSVDRLLGRRKTSTDRLEDARRI